MTRAPFVMGKAQEAFQRSAEIHDTTIGWRFINPLMKQQYGVDSMPETGENVAEEFQVRAPTRTPSRCARSSAPARRMAAGYFAEEIVPVEVPGGKAGPIVGRQGRASAPRHDARRRSPSSSRSCAIPAPSPPAMPPASTTARPP